MAQPAPDINGEECELGMPALELLRSIQRKKDAKSAESEKLKLYSELRDCLDMTGWITLSTKFEANLLRSLIKKGAVLSPNNIYVDSYDKEVQQKAKRCCNNTVTKSKYKILGLLKK